MKVVDSLASIRSTVDDYPVAVVQSQFTSQVTDHQVTMPYQCLVLVFQRIKGRDFLAGNDEQVRRCLGLNIRESQAEVILIDDLRRNVTVNDSLENSRFRQFALLHSPLAAAEITASPI